MNIDFFGGMGVLFRKKIKEKCQRVGIKFGDKHSKSNMHLFNVQEDTDELRIAEIPRTLPNGVTIIRRGRLGYGQCGTLLINTSTDNF